MIKHLLPFAAVCLLISGSAFGQSTTNFVGLTANNSTTQNIDLGGINAAFENPGVIAFFNRGAFYDGSNRAFAVGAGSSADIIFSSAVSVTGTGRDTIGDLTTGGSSSTVAPNTLLGIADGTISAFDASDTLLGSFNLNDGGFTGFSFSGPVTRLTVANNSNAADSFALIGQISVTAVPEPSTGLVVLGSLTLFGIRRRRYS